MYQVCSFRDLVDDENIGNAGLSPVIDNFRKADEDNQGGYFEYEKVKQLAENFLARKGWGQIGKIFLLRPICR